jgi:hypothetical protein
MSEIERRIASITEDHRAAYLFGTKTAADAVGCHPNKFGDWWTRTEDKLLRLCRAQPAQLAAHFAVIFARAQQERGQKGNPR